VLRAGRHQVAGHLIALTSEELLVQLSPGQFPFPEDVPQAGTVVGFRLVLPDGQEPIHGGAEVLWSNPDERDGSGKPSVALGLRISAGDAEASAQLDRVLREFRYTVLAVDPGPAELEVIRQAVGGDYRVLCCATGREALGLLETNEVGALIASDQLGDMTCSELLRRCADVLPSSRVARIVSYSQDLSAPLEELVDLGQVFYYLRKPFRVSELQQAVRRGVDAYALALENQRLNQELERVNRRLVRENRYLRRRLEVYEGFGNVIGQSAELRRAFDDLECVRKTDTTVHIQGETGTGKELVARALHFGGPRAQGPFVAQNCAGMSESLLQSTLFGHRRGSFTGADRDHPGVFEQANGGTLFLDEVAELSPPVQAALLRALQEGEVTPLGASQPVRVDARIVSATHEDLRERVRAGKFREDLYFRLVVLAVRLPPLREREGDVPLLSWHFLWLHCQHHGKTIPGFTPSALRALERYPWPGNVRELENEVERLVVLADDGQAIDAALVSEHIREAAPAPAPAVPQGAAGDGLVIPRGLAYDAAVERLERALIEGALRQAGGNVSAAAARLGMERSRLGKLRTRLGIALDGKG
jgi:DNA-binding NtrC family response regulator